MNEVFRKFAARVAELMGTSWAFGVALLLLAVWALTGPLFHYSDSWQLVINTGTTIVTFLMVFLIQNTQNRDGKAIHLKLDELIRALKGARNQMIDLEALSDEELHAIHQEFHRLSQNNVSIHAASHHAVRQAVNDRAARGRVQADDAGRDQ